MGKSFNREAAEREANEIAFQFQNSNDVVGDMSRAYHADFSGIKIHTDDEAASRVQKAGTDALATGRDIFFGKGIYERNDSASKGLLAHELAHTMQQGMVGDTAMAGGEGMNAVSEYAPAGAEQGGFISWVKGLFKKEPKFEHLGGEKATDEASLNYMAAMRAREQELFAQKRSAAMGGLGQLGNGHLDAAMLQRGSAMQAQAVKDSNEAWSKKPGNMAHALVGMGHRNTGSDVGKHDIAMRGAAFKGSSDAYLNYFKALDASGADFGALQAGAQGYGKKGYKMNDSMGAMLQDVFSIASQYALSDGGLDYIENMVNGIQDAEVFKSGETTPLNYIMKTLMTGEGIRATTAMQLGEGFTQTGEQQAKARSSFAKETLKSTMAPIEMANMSEEERAAMPPQLQTLFAQYQDIERKITEALAARKGAA